MARRQGSGELGGLLVLAVIVAAVFGLIWVGRTAYERVVDFFSGESESATRLTQAVILGDTHRFARLLENAGPSAGRDALCRAAKDSSRRSVDALLEGGAQASGSCRAEGTPLVAAVRSGDEGIVRAVLAAGGRADVNVSVDGDTPLHHALCRASPPQLGIGRILLENGANEEAVNKYGHTTKTCRERAPEAASTTILSGCTCRYRVGSVPPASCDDARCVRTH